MIYTFNSNEAYPYSLGFLYSEVHGKPSDSGPYNETHKEFNILSSTFFVMILIHNVYDSLILDSTLCFVWLPRMLFPSTRAVATVSLTTSGSLPWPSEVVFVSIEWTYISKWWQKTPPPRYKHIETLNCCFF